MERELIEMQDPVFGEGSLHTAIAAIAVEIEGIVRTIVCTAELYLSRDGVTKAATSGAKTFTTTTEGEPQTIDLSIIMPAAGFAYKVLLDILSGNEVLKAYQATEDVLIPQIGTPVITWSQDV